MSDTKFIDGLIVKAPNERAPDYVKAKLSIKRMELIAWLSQQDGDWINADIKVSQGGKWYAAIDDWKPEGKRDDAPQRGANPASREKADDFDSDSIPF